MQRQPQRRLASQRGPHQVECVDAQAADGPSHRGGQFGHGLLVIGGRVAKPRHLEGDDPLSLTQKIVGGREEESARAV